MNAFTIKDIENLTGIKAHTIRIWEQRYSFLKPKRTETNIRFYTSDELRVVLNIALLNKYGFKISHIDKMRIEEIKEKIVSLSSSEAQQERIINELIQHMIDLDMDKFEEVVDNYISARGIDKAITHILFNFLDKIGILWVTNHINPAQEHLVSNIIRQKLIVGIEKVYSTVQVNKTILLYLPEGELHELGLLYSYYLMKSKGIKTLYLGANVPLADLEFVAKLKNPDYIYSHLTSVTNNFNFDKYLQRLQVRLTGYPVVISGQVAQAYKKKTPPDISLKRSLPEVLEYIASLH